MPVGKGGGPRKGTRLHPRHDISVTLLIQRESSKDEAAETKFLVMGLEAVGLRACNLETGNAYDTHDDDDEVMAIAMAFTSLHFLPFLRRSCFVFMSKVENMHIIV
jgi:hypothetical protein